MTGFRADIQGLRAIAVLLVLFFHIFPEFLPGGYVGVDVFFVISGFLICGLILKEVERTGQISVLDFYQRRIRRLLPAASIVLIVVAIGSYFFLPQTRWLDSAYQIIASALYLENIYLHQQAIDYLSADTPASPAQHYWSLSIEEQFYIFWPLMMYVVAWVARKISGHMRLMSAALLALIFITSLYFSVTITEENPQGAYFLTHTRIWELALGGLCAALLPFISIPEKMHLPAIWVSLVAICFAGLSFSTETSFPGYAALLPTLGAALLLLSGANAPTTLPVRILGLAPMRFIGDISYSLYLWHWPIIIFAHARWGDPFTPWLGIAIGIVSIFIAWLSKTMLEDPIRKPEKNGSRFRSFMMGAGFVILSLVAAGLLVLVTPKGKISNYNLSTRGMDYPGARSLFSNGSLQKPSGASFIPSLDQVRGDLPTVYKDKCHVARPDKKPIACIYVPRQNAEGSSKMVHVDETGEENKFKTIMLVGDSHAAQWLPALKKIALKHGWSVITHTKSSCALLDADLSVGGKPYPACRAWGRDVVEDIIRRKPEFVVTSMITNHFVLGSKTQAENQENLVSGLTSTWSRLGQNDIPVFAIKGTPRFKVQVPECVASNPGKPEKCDLPRAHAMRFAGAIPAATKHVKTAHLVNMTDALCRKNICEVIVGNVLVYRDQHHITATYMKTMSEFLERKIRQNYKGEIGD